MLPHFHFYWLRARLFMMGFLIVLSNHYTSHNQLFMVQGVFEQSDNCA